MQASCQHARQASPTGCEQTLWVDSRAIARQARRVGDPTGDGRGKVLPSLPAITNRRNVR